MRYNKTYTKVELSVIIMHRHTLFSQWTSDPSRTYTKFQDLHLKGLAGKVLVF